MRLISQRGHVDINYENCELLLVESQIIANGISNEYTMGAYTTMEKAKLVMQMVRDFYVGLPIVIQNVEFAEDDIKQLEEWKIKGIICNSSGSEMQRIETLNNRIFKFPLDEEVVIDG